MDKTSLNLLIYSIIYLVKFHKKLKDRIKRHKMLF